MATSMECSANDNFDISTTNLFSNFVIISWNVLHIIHELNYAKDQSLVINRYSINDNCSSEKLRLNDIIKVLRELLVQYSTLECFICLQEVPGDLLPMLREMLDSRAGMTLASKPLLYTHTYSRIPRIKGQYKNSPYTDSNESLVIIHYNPRIAPKEGSESKNIEKYAQNDDRLLWTPCPIDPGKGALTLTTATGFSVINTHVPYNNEAANQLLRNIPWPKNSNPFVCVGDINRDAQSLLKLIDKVTMGESSTLFFPVTTDKPTRVALNQNGTLRKQWIDHFVLSISLKDFVLLPAIVYDEIGDISDHYPISLMFEGNASINKPK